MPPQPSGPPASMAMAAVEGAAALTMYVAWGQGSLQGVEKTKGTSFVPMSIDWPLAVTTMGGFIHTDGVSTALGTVSNPHSFSLRPLEGKGSEV